MMFLNLKENMSIREISRISGISLSTYYYCSSRRNVKRIIQTCLLKGTQMTG